MLKKYQDLVIAQIKEDGADIIGVSPVDDWEETKRGHRPLDWFPDAKSFIIFGTRFVEPIRWLAPARVRSHYGHIMYEFLEQITLKAIRNLQRKGYHSYFFEPHGFPDSKEKLEKDPSYQTLLYGDVSLKQAAYKAGLGVFGKSCLLLTPQYGPRVHLHGFLTNAPFTPGQPLDEDLCGNCTICINACPGNAISAERGFDPLKCLEYEKLQGEPAVNLDYKVCIGYCLLSCPIGKPAETKRWQPYPLQPHRKENP